MAKALSRPASSTKPASTLEETVAKRIELALEKMFDAGYLMSSVDPSRQTSLRVSSLPFCARKWFYSLLESTGKRRADDTYSSFFTSIGTVVHSVLQAALLSIKDELEEDLSIELLRDWICMECGHKHVYIPKPDDCKKCGHSVFKGEEHTVYYGRHTSGHIDDTIQFAKKYQFVWDYKTTTKYKIESGKLPNPGNVAQIETYSAIKANEGHPVKGWALIYICRDNPRTRKVVLRLFKPGDVEKILARLDNWELEFRKARRAYRSLELEEAVALPYKCKEEFEEDCKFRRVCEAGSKHVTKHYQETIVKLHKRRKANDATK